MEEREIQLIGHVVRNYVDAGSKSARPAVMLETNDGVRYTLRLLNEPSFGQSTLDDLVGKRLRIGGILVDRTLIVRDWNED
jgi:hypothetical protein